MLVWFTFLGTSVVIARVIYFYKYEADRPYSY